MRTISKLVLLAGFALIVGFYAKSQDNHKLNNSKMEGEMNTLQSPEKNKETVRNLYEKILNERKLALLDRIISEDYTGIQGEKGVAGFAGTVNSVISGFPDIKWTVEDLIAEGDKVVIRWTWTGTNTGTLLGLAPSNKHVTNHAIAIYQFKNDKIVHAWMQSDRLGVLQQVGVISADAVPSPATAK